MKRTFFTYCIAFLALILVCQGVNSQALVDGLTGERIEACTDRTMYVSGEQILFSAIIFNNKNLCDEYLSRILYCELITPDGNRIAGGKYLLKESSGEGCLTIPEEAISGIYFLKFYTRFMRNGSTAEYKYIMLKIINPFKTEVLSGSDAVEQKGLADTDPDSMTGNQTMNILSGKTTFSPREEIRLNISMKSGKEVSDKLCLAIVPATTYDGTFTPEGHTPKSTENELYLPETRGISISGQLIDKESGEPIPRNNVNLSIIGDKDILVYRTDSSGRFFFALPDYTGKRDIFLCANDMPVIVPEILIDNDFCSKPVDLPSPIFTLDEEEVKAAYKMAVNSRITAMYTENPISEDFTEEENSVSFYGEPTDVFIMEKYIDLPTLEEYFSELPVMLKLRKVDGRKQFRFYTTLDEMTFHPPLILVDWVAVNDITKILAMSPLDIERIEIVNSPYVKGNMLYGGIISFVSKKNDFAGIDLPTSGTFVNYTFLEECSANIPRSSSPANIPDSRNTVFWDPAVQTKDDGTASISFRAPDTPGTYHISLRGISTSGEIILAEELFVVKEE